MMSLPKTVALTYSDSDDQVKKSEMKQLTIKSSTKRLIKLSPIKSISYIYAPPYPAPTLCIRPIFRLTERSVYCMEMLGRKSWRGPVRLALHWWSLAVGGSVSYGGRYLAVLVIMFYIMWMFPWSYTLINTLTRDIVLENRLYLVN